jgi:membrane protease YdiL (CAAX protease family)
MTHSPSRLHSVGTAIGLTYGSLVIGSITTVIAASVLGGSGSELMSRPSVRLLLNTVMLQGVTFGGIAILYLRVHGLSFDFIPFTIPDRHGIAVIIVGILTLLGLLLGASVTISALGLESAENQVVTVGERNPAVFLLLIPLSFILIGPGEELLFRGLVQGLLRETFHPARAIILASALFASIHLFSLSGEGKIVYIGIAFVLALVLGATYEYTENLTVPAMIHGAYNAVQFAGAYLTATGGV